MRKIILSLSILLMLVSTSQAQYLSQNFSLEASWQYNNGGNTGKVTVFENYLVFSTDRHVNIYSLLNLDSPVLIHSIFVPNIITDIKITNKQLFISAGHSGILIYDITFPFNPILLTQEQFKYSNSTLFRPIGDIYSFNDKLIILSNAYSISESGELNHLGSFSPDKETQFHTKKQYAHSVDYFVASDHRGFSIFDISLDQEEPLGSFLFDDDLGHYNSGISIRDTLLYYTYEHDSDYVERIMVFSIEDPTNPKLLAESVIGNPPYVTKSQIIDGSNLYQARMQAHMHNSIIFAYDISTPNNITLIDSLRFEVAVQGLAMKNSTIFVAEGNSIHIYNRDMDTFDHIYTLSTAASKEIHKSLVTKQLIVSEVPGEGVILIDKQSLSKISDLEHPEIDAIFLENNHLMVSENNSLYIYDISNPDDIKQLHIIEDLFATSIKPFNNSLLVCNRYSGTALYFLDQTTLELTPINDIESCGAIEVFNDLVFIVESSEYYGSNKTDLSVFQFSDGNEFINHYKESFWDEFWSDGLIFQPPYLITFGGSIEQFTLQEDLSLSSRKSTGKYSSQLIPFGDTFLSNSTFEDGSSGFVQFDNTFTDTLGYFKIPGRSRVHDINTFDDQIFISWGMNGILQVSNDFITSTDNPISNSTDLQDGFLLNQNYPNPFNPTSTIAFSIPEKSTIKLSIFNSLGQKIVDLASGEYISGSYSFTFDASTWSSGLYYYTLQTVFGIKTKKMLLIK